jgi:hypothetical protein
MSSLGKAGGDFVKEAEPRRTLPSVNDTVLQPSVERLTTSVLTQLKDEAAAGGNFSIPPSPILMTRKLQPFTQDKLQQLASETKLKKVRFQRILSQKDPNIEKVMRNIVEIARKQHPRARTAAFSIAFFSSQPAHCATITNG